jgi:glutamate-ammonia-ligase adenylyltransferase
MDRPTLARPPRPEWTRAWPAAADPAAAARLRERIAATGAAAARLAAGRTGAALLDCLGGNSPYLADLAVREAAMLRPLIARGPAACVARALHALGGVPPGAERARIAAALRRAKRQVALATACADLGGLWDLARITAALSDLAEAALRLAVDHLLLAAHRTGELVLADPGAPSQRCGFAVLGMGKLGARELNYSSDIDLVLLFDPAAQPDATPGATFGRIARGLATLMEARDADGYVFRTDFRLRPDPAATPLAVALPTALVYYESMGQTWERAAYIKARPVAGDMALGAAFLEQIRPFVWRRHLDFAAIADIHAMKRRIDQHRGGGLAATGPLLARLAGHNLKLGQGGIREVEFIAQALQMAWGGRDPALREPATLGALRRLAAAGKLAPRAATQLAGAYRFLRGIEHRLQMVADRQTHSLPADAPGMARFAVFAGFADAEGFAATLLRHLACVQRHFAALFENAAPADARLRFLAEDAQTQAALAAMGFSDPAHVAASVRRWLSGEVRALRTQRARDLLERLLPDLLAALARQTQPDGAFARFDTLVSRLPAGVQLFSLIQRNPMLMERIAAVLGAAPSLADHLAGTPSALEGLLAPSEVDPAPARSLRRQLGDARDLEDAIALTRRFVRGEEFRLAVATMEGRLDADAAGSARTALADAALDGLLGHVMTDFTARHGTLAGGGMAIVALGKAGGQEMMAGSDLDLMLLYDHPEGAASAAGLAPSQYYSRLAHAVIAAVTARGAEGPLYEVDMRLRPSGNKGPVAVSLASFRCYHAADAAAWTWERMALTRARVVAGPAPLRRRIAEALRLAVGDAGPAERIRADAAAMRARLTRDLPATGPWDVKHRPGGLMEVEFIAQVLQLVHARDHPAALHPNTVTALRRLQAAGVLGEADAAALARADRLWRTVQGMLRITMGRSLPASLPEPALDALLHAAARAAGSQSLDLPGLHATLDAAAGEVRALFIRHVGEPQEEAK